jgi:predicted RNA-binding Zn-ribbon protein involved in translation (DUF1610 family)
MSEKKYDDWDEVINEALEEKRDDNKSIQNNKIEPNDNVNPFMTSGEYVLMWGLFILGGYFIWHGFNVIIGVALNLIIGFSLISFGILIRVSVNNRVRTYQNISHKCSNCGKTIYLTKAQENYVKSGNKITCPHCGLDSN